MPLTDVQVRNAKPKAAVFKLFDERGLYLQVNPSGGKLWRFRFRYADKEGLLVLGSYPDVSLAQAREKRDAARSTLANGGNPAEVKRYCSSVRADMLQRAAKSC